LKTLLLAYSTYITPRIEYIFNHLLGELAGFEIKLTCNLNEYQAYDGPSLNYAEQKIKPNEIHIPPNGLLFANSIIPLTASVKTNSDKIFLYFDGENIEANRFDLFAASFYLLSRYEEYLSFQPDIFNRFEAASSILYKHGLLEIPLIDKWALEIKDALLSVYPELSAKEKISSAIITIDIDQAFAFKGRGIKRNILSFLKNAFGLHIKMLITQIKFFLHLSNDPFDTYGYLSQQQKQANLSFIYFINIGDYSQYDKNLPASNTQLKKLLKTLQQDACIGLHPSYYSNGWPGKFHEEKSRLESIISNPITKSRQHYLKLNFPSTYRHLIEVGLKEDYTMGYASAPGFRAGTCTPFFWFDLEKNSPTQLKIFPITYMEGSLGEDLKLTPTDAQNKIESLTETVKQYRGCFVCIWHNHTVNDKFFWKGWKQVFENNLQKLKASN
jgi:hypothetical protein